VMIAAAIDPDGSKATPRLSPQQLAL